jgi:hypothetical protein
LIFPTLDGKNTFSADLNAKKLKKAEKQLAKLKKTLFYLHGVPSFGFKSAIIGMAMGIEAYLELLKRGKNEGEDYEETHQQSQT